MSSTTQNNIQSDLKIQIQLNKEQLKLLENMPNMAYIFEKWSYNNEDCKFIYCSEAIIYMKLNLIRLLKILLL